MIRNDKRRFIRDMCRGLRAELLANVDRTPDGWDGHELRVWAADTLREKWCARSTVLMKGRRLREYRNARLVTNI